MEASVGVGRKKKFGKKAREVTYKRLKGGVTSRATFPEVDENNNEMEYGGKNEEMVHPSMAHAVKHMKATMGDAFGQTGAMGTPKGSDKDGDEPDADDE